MDQVDNLSWRVEKPNALLKSSTTYKNDSIVRLSLVYLRINIGLNVFCLELDSESCLMYRGGKTHYMGVFLF